MSGSRRADGIGGPILGTSEERQGPALVRLAVAALLVLAIVVPTALIALTLVAADAQGTLGYDFLAYHQAASRVLAGQPLYDTSFQDAGGFGLFYYPPFFAPLVLPFGFLAEAVATWLWIVLLIGAFLAGTAILPVGSRVKWLILLFGGISWPLAYALKLGQVGPLLYLAFAVGWRWLDDPARLGVSSALGAAIKLQPGLLFVWALLSGRWRAVVWGAVVLAVLGVLATILAGAQAWPDFLKLLGQVADPIQTERNLTPGAVAFRLGVPSGVASVLQLMTTLVALVLVIWAARGAQPDAGFLVTVVASQLVSPILWEHYAVLLLLPVAWLLERRHWWAAAIPLLTPTPLLFGLVVPEWIYPSVFIVALFAVALGGRRPPSVDDAPRSLRSYLGARP
jgi:hypothetical protein